MFKKLFKIVAWCIGIVLITCIIVFIIAWKSPSYYIVKKPQPQVARKYIPFERYNANHARPYIIQTPTVIIFGAEHTRDAADGQITALVKKVANLKTHHCLGRGATRLFNAGAHESC